MTAPHCPRYTYLFDLSLSQGYPLLLVGPTGTGKTTIVMRHLLGGTAPANSSKGFAAAGALESEQAAEQGEAAEPAGGEAAGGKQGGVPPPGLVGGVAADKWVPMFLTLSARTTANMAQDQVRG